jgi:hypothetical protein
LKSEESEIKIIYLLLILVSPIFADYAAIIDDGREVILKEDHTWTFATISNNNELVTLKFKNLELLSDISELKKQFIEEEIQTVNSSSEINTFALVNTFAGYKSFLYFYYYKNKLFKGAAIFQIETTNDDNYIHAYKEIKKKLTKKYGNPSDEHHKKSSNEYISDAMSIQTGDGYFYSKWDLGGNEIYLELSGDNYKFNFYINYKNKNLYTLTEKLKEDSKINEL